MPLLGGVIHKCHVINLIDNILELTYTLLIIFAFVLLVSKRKIYFSI